MLAQMCEERSRPVAASRTSTQVFVGVSALLFAFSAALTALWCASMPAMEGMRMPGGWTMSMVWMRMPGQTWTGAAASFLLMWVVMMLAMMMPSLAPVLWRYRQSLLRTGETCTGRLTLLAGAAYFFVWTALGMLVFPLGIALSAMEMRHPALSRTVPVAVAVVFLIAGVLQFTTWKANRLTCCKGTNEFCFTLPSTRGTAWKHGLRLGLHCASCCASWTAILLAAGVMDLRVMLAVTIAISAERLAPAGERVARATGLAILGAGVYLMVCAC
jgi:predicted metal-binding membrane protein